MVRAKLDLSLSVSQHKGVLCLVVPLLHGCLCQHAHALSTLLNFFQKSYVQQRHTFQLSFYLYWYGCSLKACGRCHLAFGRWGRLAGLLYGCIEWHAWFCMYIRSVRQSMMVFFSARWKPASVWNELLFLICLSWKYLPWSVLGNLHNSILWTDGLMPFFIQDLICVGRSFAFL